MELLGKRSQTLLLKEEDLARVPKEDVISIEDVEPTPFPKAEPSTIALVGQEAQHEADWARYRTEKEEWEEHNAVPADVKRVDTWVPVTQVHRVTLDGYELRVFHALRGPILAAIQNEDMHRAFVFSPCMIDPNITRGRVHFLPIAFAGYKFTIYKHACLGESVPQEAEIRGYPAFLKNNKQGDYTFRMKTSYHHINADLSDDARVASVELMPREAQEGLVPTSSVREAQAVDRTRLARAVKQDTAASTTP